MRRFVGMCLLFVFMGILLLGGSTASAQNATLRGFVTEAFSAEPIDYIQVRIDNETSDMDITENHTDQDGYYEFDVENLTYDLWAMGDSSYSSLTTTVVVEGDTWFNFTLEEYYPLSGYVNDSRTGEPVEDVELGFQSLRVEWIRTRTTNAQGFFELFVPPGSLNISVSGDSAILYTEYIDTVVIENETWLNFSLESGSIRIRGYVRNATGYGMNGTWILAGALEPWFNDENYTDADGYYEVRGVKAFMGVFAELDGYNGATWTGNRTDTEIWVNLTMYELVPINVRGSISLPNGTGVRVDVSFIGHRNRSTLSEPDGSYDLNFTYAGDYMVRVWDWFGPFGTTWYNMTLSEEGIYWFNITLGEAVPVALDDPSVNGSSVTLSWTGYVEEGFSLYVLFLSNVSGTLGDPVWNSTDINATTYTVVNLTRNMTHHFTVRVHNEWDSYADSNNVSAFIPLEVVLPELVPVALQTPTVDGVNATLNWTIFNGSYFRMYEVFRSDVNGSLVDAVWNTTDINITSYEIVNLTRNMTHHFSVRVHDWLDRFADSNNVSAFIEAEGAEEPEFDFTVAFTMAPDEPKGGDDVEVTAVIDNLGTVEDRYTAQLLVDGEIVDAFAPSVPWNSSTTHTFEWVAVAGTFDVVVQVTSISTNETRSVTVSLTVAEGEVDDDDDTPGFEAVVVGASVILSLALVGRRRRF